MRQVDLLGVRIDDTTTEETLQAIEAFLQGDRLHLVCTPNADHVVKARHDREFRDIINGADLAIPDGMAVIYASRLLGAPLRGNVAGRLLVPRLCERAAQRGWRVFFLGAAPGVAAEAARRLVARYPGLQVAGAYAPPLGFERDPRENQQAVDTVNAARPDVLLVALGAPKQEKWLARNREALEARVGIGVGGAFDIIAGRVREAPGWATRLGLEWCFRLIQEPRRLGRRYLIEDQEFVRAVLWFWLRRSLGRA